MKMIQCISVRRTLAFFYRAAGGVRWKSSFRPAPVFTATPSRALIDEQISIKGRFLPPQSPVTVCAQMRCDDCDLWESFAHYNTSTDGTINLSRDQSVGGSYSGCEPMGLFWALQPAPGSREGLRQGHVSPSERQSAELAAVTTERWYMAPGVQRKEIRQDGVVGTLFLPPGPGPFPAMLDMWGMGGGLVEYRAALFASRGYASFSLAYFGHKDLPGPPNHINVGSSYFESAFQLLQNHRRICADRVGIIGLSYGVYPTLRLATQNSVKPSCLICINGPVGSNFLIPDENTRTDQTDSNQKYWTYNDQGYVMFRDVSSLENLTPDVRVKIENINCPIMTIVGEDDLSTSSKENADLIEETLTAAGKSQLLTYLTYPGAGHLIEPPYAPNARVSLWSVKPTKMFTLWGGHPAPHAAAQEHAWKNILDFMETNLRK